MSGPCRTLAGAWHTEESEPLVLRDSRMLGAVEKIAAPTNFGALYAT